MNTYEQMRDALELALSLIDLEEGCDWKPIKQEDIDFIKAALASPPRNCDVGTASEQIDRFHEFCQSNLVYLDEFHGYDCRKECPAGIESDKHDEFCDECKLLWAQMPYEEGGVTNGK